MKSIKFSGIAGNVAEIKIETLRVRECPDPSCETPPAISELWKEHVTKAPWFDSNKEALVVFLLDTRLKCVGFNLVALGSLNECTAHPREIFRPAIVAGAYALVLAHNHPSGNPSPSSADRRLTSNLREAASILQIQFMDHVIIGDASCSDSGQGFFSFRDAGLL
jgi:DNA repair protein RadC